MQRTSIILALFFICTNVFAQQYSFVHYTPKDGLINSRVRKAYQDGKGRMYFLTFGGLSVYDGARFKNYSIPDGLGTGLVNDIIESGEDSLLIATNAGVLNKLVKGKISRVETGNDLCPVINYFYRHSNGSLYLSCDQGLYQLEGNSMRKLNIFSLTKDPGKLPTLGNITGTGNYLIICTDDLKEHEGLYLYDIRNNGICDSIPGRFFHPLGKDQNDHILVSAPGAIYTLDPFSISRGKLKLISPQPVPAGDIALWFLYRPDSLHIDKLVVGGSRQVFGAPVPDEIRNADIRYALADKEGSVWLCSNGGGVYKMVQSPLHIFENPIGKNLKGSIYAAYYSPYGTWYSSDNDKLYRRSGDVTTQFTVNLKQVPEIFFANQQKLIGNDARNIYEATISNSEKKMVFQRIVSLPDTTYFTRRRIVDRYGAIVSGLKGGLGIWKDHHLVFYLPLSSFDLVEGLAFDKNGLLWIVTRYSDAKVCRLHPENPSQYLETICSFSKSQINGSPRCMAIDKEGMVWIGTRDNGLSAYKPGGNKLKELYHFTTQNGITDNFIVSVACDSSNNIIAGTQTGVDRIILRSNGDHRVENLTKTHNYFSYINDVWVSSDGMGYARTFSGELLVISPAQMAKASRGPGLLLEEMKVNANAVIAKDHFEYNENNISFMVAAPSFIDERQVRYSYLLEGSGNQQWSDTTFSNSIINFSNLAYGKYSLKVKAFFPSAIYPPAGLSYSFEISPPWWQTWWFRSMAALAFAGMLIQGLRFYYKRRLERQMASLEKQQAIEKERTRIATDMHDDLGAGLSRIKFLSETIGIKQQQQQPIKEDIAKIREYSHEMIDKMGEIVWALNKKNDSLSDLLSYSRSYAVDYLSQNGIKCDVEVPDNLPALFVSGEFRRNIYLTLKEALHNVVKHAQADKVDIKISVDQHLKIIIRDDGIGFNTNKIRPFSNGLLNMGKRMSDIGGSIRIENTMGTSVALTAPLN